MKPESGTFLFVIMINVCLLQCTKSESESGNEEVGMNYTLTTTVNNAENVARIIFVKSRFSFNITHKEVWDNYNTVYFYWMKSINKGIYFETKDVSDNYESKSNFYKLQRNDVRKWKLRNITDAISGDKIERIKGGRRTSSNDSVHNNDSLNQIFKIKILPRNNFRLVKTHPRNRNKIKIFEAEFHWRFPIVDFIYVDYVEDILFFCALHDDVDSSLFMAFGKKPESKTFEFTRSLENVLCINSQKNFPDTWLSSSVSGSLVDIYRSVSSRGVLFASQFRKKISLEESRMLHVDHLTTTVSFDFGKTWSVLRLQNHCSVGGAQPHLYLDLSFSRLFFDKSFLGIQETSKVPGFMISTGHLVYPDDAEMYPGVFVSQDGGLTWTKIFDERFLMAMSSGGELLIGIRQCLSGPTKHLFISYDFGKTWKAHQIFDKDVCVHEVLASPFDVFAILSSKREREMWIVSVVDFEKSALSLRKCSRKDVQLRPLGSHRQFCVHGHRILNYRRNSNVQCKILNYDSKFLNFSCSCTEKDFFCANESCRNMTSDEVRTSFASARSDLEMKSVAVRLGLRKEVGNTCLLSRRNFHDRFSQLPTCTMEAKILSNLREAASSAPNLCWSQILRILFYAIFFSRILLRKV